MNFPRTFSIRLLLFSARVFRTEILVGSDALRAFAADFRIAGDRIAAERRADHEITKQIRRVRATVPSKPEMTELALRKALRRVLNNGDSSVRELDTRAGHHSPSQHSPASGAEITLGIFRDHGGYGRYPGAADRIRECLPLRHLLAA